MLKLFEFGRKIINWIKILYKKPKCEVTNNNYSSHFFEIKRGERQRDLLSTTILYFALNT